MIHDIGTMEPRADKHVKEHLLTERKIKKEAEEEVARTAEVDLEIDVTHLKDKPGGLAQYVKSEPVLLVKEEILEDSSQDEQQHIPATSTRAIIGRTSVAAAAGHAELLHIKEELHVTDLDIGPTGLQLSHCRTYQTDLNDVRQKNTILNLKPKEALSRLDETEVVCSRVRNEAIESSLKDDAALSPCNSITSKKGVVQSQLYGCKVCEQNYIGKQQLSRHTYQVHGGTQNRQIYKCDKCPKVCKSKEYLRSHIIRVHSTGSHKCTQCIKEFKCKEYLLKHVRYIHSDQQYECVICKKIHNSRTALLAHVSDYHRKSFVDPENGNYCCDKCRKTFQSKTGFKRHCKNMHGTERHKCIECDKEYKCMRYLKIHINAVHSKQQFECDICKKIFQSRRNIWRHIVSHHSPRWPDSHASNYSCDHCQKSFRKKPLLQAHIKIVHGERIYQCPKCNKAFKCSKHLQQHKKGFHRKPQNECEVCHTLYTTGNKLRTHIKKAHSLEDIPSKSDLYSQELYNQLSIVSTVSTGIQQDDAGAVKSEPTDAELELGPVVFQHMDSNYRPYKRNLSLTDTD